MVISSFPQIYEPGCERQASLWLRGQFGTGVQCRYLTVETHTQAGTGTMFNKLKYPARGDLLVRGNESLGGTGASYLEEGPRHREQRVAVLDLVPPIEPQRVIYSRLAMFARRKCSQVGTLGTRGTLGTLGTFRFILLVNEHLLELI